MTPEIRKMAEDALSEHWNGDEATRRLHKLAREVLGQGRETPSRRGIDLLVKLVTAIESDKSSAELKRIIREGAPILHCRPSYESMSAESRGALVSIVTAALDQFAKPPAPPVKEGE